MAMEFVPLLSLDETSGSVPVQVRIYRSWEAKNTNSGALIGLELIVADIKGTPMWVQIKSSLVQRHRHLLTVGSVYSFKHFNVSVVHGKFYMQGKAWLLMLGKHNIGCYCKKSGCLRECCECYQGKILSV